MALANYVYRLKAEAGDASPIDKKGTAGALTGGTIALVDRGSGDWAWQFSGGQASVALPAKTADMTTAGGGITIAGTLRVTTYANSSDTNAVLLGVGPALLGTSATSPNGLQIGQQGVNYLRIATVGPNFKILPTPPNPIGTTTDHTFVLKLVANASGVYDEARIWIGTTGRTGSTPDAVTSQSNLGSFAATYFMVNAQNAAVQQLKDFVYWTDEETDADCATLADTGVRATLDSTATTVAGAVGGASAVGVQASVQGTATISAAIGAASAAGIAASVTNGSASTTIVGAIGAASATGFQAAFGTFIQTDVIPNNTNTVLANTAVVWTWMPGGRIGAMSGLTRTDGTGTTDANGRLAPGIAKVSGALLVAAQHTSALDDDVFYQAF